MLPFSHCFFLPHLLEIPEKWPLTNLKDGVNPFAKF
jgi:hypothetical protein